jgi:hypothetical protein
VAARRWQITVGDDRYDVEVKRSWTGAIRLLVNGAEVVRRDSSMGSGQRILFPLGGRAATLAWITYGRGGVYYDLILDGRSLSTGEQARPAANPYETLGASWLIFFAIAAIFGAVLLFGALPELRLALEGREASARVTGGRVASSRSTTYYLRYTFVATDGDIRAAEGRVEYGTYHSTRVGDEIRVVYVPSAPEIQRPASFDERIWIFGLAGMFGAGLPFTAVMVWRAYRLRAMRAALADRGVRTSATVTKISKELANQGTRHISYTYEDGEGRLRKGRSPRLFVEEASAYSPGSVAAIAYDANDPGNSVWIGSADPKSTPWVITAK